MRVNKLKVEYRSDHPSGLPMWRVLTVVGSIQYHPGQVLTKDEMTDICNMTGMWEVTIVGAEQ